MAALDTSTMLCTRPSPGTQVDSALGLKPFLPTSSTVGLDPVGITPAHKVYPPSLAPKQVSVTTKARAAVRALEDENRELAAQDEQRRAAEAIKSQQVTSFSTQLRSAILSGEEVSFWRPAKHAEAVKQTLEAKAAAFASLSAAAPFAQGASSPSSSPHSSSPARQVRFAKAGNTATTTSPSPAAAAEDVTDFVDGLMAEATSRLAASRPEHTAMNSFVDDLLREATTALEPPPSSHSDRADRTASASASATTGAAGQRAGGRSGSAGGAGGRGAGRPAWALSSDQAERLEDAEEEELLRFTEGLDFDAFVCSLDDVQLQEDVKAMVDPQGQGGPTPGNEKAWRAGVVRAMNHVAMRQAAAVGAAAAARRAARGEDDDGASVAGLSEGGASTFSRATTTSRMKSEAAAARRAALAGEGGAEGGWDSSTRAGDDTARLDRARGAQQEAFEFLRENPELKAVHSPASVRAMISKTAA